MGEQNNVNVSLNLTGVQNAGQQVDQFALALSRVNQQARRTFAQLQELSQRYQQQGFLGMADQRTLEQGLRQWERMTQVMALRVRGQAAQLASLPPGPFGSPEAARRGQAQGVLTRLTLHQQALGTMQEAISTVFGPTPTGVAMPWSPPGPLTPLQQAHAALQLQQQRQAATATSAAQARLRQIQQQAIAAGMVTGQIAPGPQRLTPLQAAHLIEQQNVATAAQYTQQMRGAAALANLPNVQTQMIAAQMLLRQTPLQQAHMLQFGGLSPLQQAHATQQAQQAAVAQQGLQRAQLVSLMAQMGPQGPGWFGPGGGGAQLVERGGQLVGGALGAIQRPARLGLGAAAGIGIYQTLTESMDLYRQRAQGIIDVGMRLDLNFARVGATIDTLRDKYQVLAHDSIAAQLALARIGGGPGLLDPAVRMGAAYGIAAPQAAALAGTFSRLTVAGPAPLSTVAALATMNRRGITPMGTEEVLEETLRIAGTGGTAAVPVGVGMSARWMGLISGLGERYNVPGAASQFYGRYAAGLNESGDPAVQAVRVRALRDLARRQGPMLTIGEGPGAETVDLRTITGLRIAMEQASQSEVIQEAYRRTTAELSGANPVMQELAFGRVLGAGLGPTESRRLMRDVGARGGFLGLGGRVETMPSPTSLQEQIEQTRLQGRAAAEEFQVALTQAIKEAGLERLGEPMVKASNDLKQALIGLGEMISGGGGVIDSLKTAMGSLDDTTKALLGGLGVLSSSSWGGQAVSWFTLLSGMFGTPPAQPGMDYPVLGNPFESAAPGRTGPSLLPKR